MRKLVLVVHLSLDGFVARPGGALDGFPSGLENLEFVTSLTESADATLLGRRSYEMLEAYWPTAKDHPGATDAEKKYSDWYNGAQKIVVSKTIKDKDRPGTTVFGGDFVNKVRQLKSESGKSILIFGSPSVSQILMDAEIIDEYWIFFNAVIFGDGIPLFKQSPRLKKLKLIDSKTFGNGEVALHYLPV